MKKVYLLTICLFIISLASYSQNGELRVEKMYLDATDTEASANRREDRNGVPMALLKIEIPLENATIESVAGVEPVGVKNPGELWAYASTGEYDCLKRITLYHSEYSPLTIEFANYQIESLEGRCVYRIKVVVPSALLTDADREKNNLNFDKAEKAYQRVIADNETSSSFKEYAQKTLEQIPVWKKVEYAAELYYNRYKRLQVQSEVNKKEVINVLDSASYWYGRLYEISGIVKAREHQEEIESVLDPLLETRIIQGRISLNEKKRGQQLWIKLKSKPLNNVRVDIENHKNKKPMFVSTDNNGFFRMEFKESSSQTRMKFTYHERGSIYQSTIRTVNTDIDLGEIKLVKQ